MKSIRDIYKAGRGPSSSHTMGPERACMIFRRENPDAAAYRAVLYGSLSKTGPGHGTNRIIEETLSPLPCQVIFDSETTDLPHPNTMELRAISGGKVAASLLALSVGGGTVRYPERPEIETPDVYPQRRYRDIAEVCRKNNWRLSDYVFHREDPDFPAFLHGIWNAMRSAVEELMRFVGEMFPESLWHGYIR